MNTKFFLNSLKPFPQPPFPQPAAKIQTAKLTKPVKNKLHHAMSGDMFEKTPHIMLDKKLSPEELKKYGNNKQGPYPPKDDGTFYWPKNPPPPPPTSGAVAIPLTQKLKMYA